MTVSQVSPRHRGTTVSWGNYWSYWDSCFDWNPDDGCIGGLSGIGGVIFSSGIDNFECWDYPAGMYWCQCAY